MGKITIQEAIENMEYNYALAQKFPKNQKEFAAEYAYSNPNNYQEMKELYTFYGYQYSPSLWAYQQTVYQQADQATKERIQYVKQAKSRQL